jgi:hypothetical protein
MSIPVEMAGFNTILDDLSTCAYFYLLALIKLYIYQLSIYFRALTPYQLMSIMNTVRLDGYSSLLQSCVAALVGDNRATIAFLYTYWYELNGRIIFMIATLYHRKKFPFEEDAREEWRTITNAWRTSSPRAPLTSFQALWRTGYPNAARRYSRVMLHRLFARRTVILEVRELLMSSGSVRSVGPYPSAM